MENDKHEQKSLLESVCDMGFEFVRDNVNCFDIQSVMVFIAIVA